MPILDNVARSARSVADSVPDTMIQQVENILNGLRLSVVQIETNIDKYLQDRLTAAVQWALTGKMDMEKLRLSLEAYKMALSIGLQLFSM